jgi:hypothetical protein
MALTESYLTTVKNVESFFETIKSAKAPERFTTRFLADLGFKNTNDRLLISVMKGLGFLDENGVPTQRYFAYLDDSQSATVLAEGIEEAYEDLFRLNTRAYQMGKPELIGKLKSLTEGKKSERVIDAMAVTFQSLSKLAKFSEPRINVKADKKVENLPEKKQVENLPKKEDKVEKSHEDKIFKQSSFIDAVTYRIEINLPPSRDKAVYDAIFRSLKEHLL